MNDSIHCKQAVIGIARRDDRLLVIERSQHVIAPGMICFPGGSLEQDEDEAEALVREWQEELGATVRPTQCIWISCSVARRVQLHWWMVEIESETLTPNRAEVDRYWWASVNELLKHPRLLDTNRPFLELYSCGDIVT